mmetsp:Transcript_57483/g.147819  ORF Transcript_57483/g.147819 Transcript_57483/m.147819 type:complete len:230 (-) Transcript_57483:446-1135(-)
MTMTATTTARIPCPTLPGLCLSPARCPCPAKYPSPARYPRPPTSGPSPARFPWPARHPWPPTSGPSPARLPWPARFPCPLLARSLLPARCPWLPVPGPSPARRPWLPVPAARRVDAGRGHCWPRPGPRSRKTTLRPAWLRAAATSSPPPRRLARACLRGCCPHPPGTRPRDFRRRPPPRPRGRPSVASREAAGGTLGETQAPWSMRKNLAAMLNHHRIAPLRGARRRSR